jgi:MFS superfamily sulfate permease-like transporter
VIASLGVIVLGVLQGIVIAIALAVALYFRRGWQPHGAVLGRVQATGEWHNIAEFPEARVEPGVVVYRWEAPLFFANCTSFRTQLRQAVTEAEADRPVAWVVVQCEAVTDIDVSAAQMLEQLDRELNARDIHLAFVELRSRLQELLRRYELFDQIDQDHFYPSLEAGLAAIEQENRTRPPSGESAAEQ